MPKTLLCPQYGRIDAMGSPLFSDPDISRNATLVLILYKLSSITTLKSLVLRPLDGDGEVLRPPVPCL